METINVALQFERFAEFYCALLAFLLFAFSVVVFGLARGSAPNESVSKWHLRFAAFYVAFFFLFAFEEATFGIPQSLSFLAGAFAYFVFHYVIFYYVIAISCRSVSATIAVDLLTHDGQASEETLFNGYADGRGFESIKETRLEDMLSYGLIEKKGDQWQASKRGKRSAVITSVVLKLWGLKQLSEDQEN